MDNAENVTSSIPLEMTNLTIDNLALNLTDLLSFKQPFDVPYIRAIFIILYVIVFLCCVLGNTIVIYVILRHRKMRNVTNFFLANLAVSDLCVGLFCVLPSLTTFLSPYWILGEVLCKVYYFIQCTSYTASVLILTLISLERYFAIIHPMLNKRITRMCLLRVAVIITWLCAALYGMPNLIAYSIYRVEDANETLAFCVITGNLPINMGVYSIVNSIVLYALPLLLITVMYVRISSVLWRSGRNMGLTSTTHYASRLPTNSRHISSKITCPRCAHDPVAPEPTSIPTVEASINDSGVAHKNTHLIQRETSMGMTNRKSINWFLRHIKSSNQWARSVDDQDREVTLMCNCVTSDIEAQSKSFLQMLHKRKKVCHPLTTRRKVIRLLICIIVSFAVCVMPHHIRLLWQYWFASSISVSFEHLLIPPTTFLFFYANSALNPFLYALLSDHFRRAFLELLPSGELCRKQNGRHDVMSQEGRMTGHKTSTFESSGRTTSALSTLSSNGTRGMSTIV